MHYVLFYTYVKDSQTRKQPFRDAHLKLGWEAHARGELLLGGVFPEDEAMLIFQGDSPAVAEKFVKSDPYFLNGIVTDWQVRVWTTAIGTEASHPVRPA